MNKIRIATASGKLKWILNGALYIGNANACSTTDGIEYKSNKLIVAYRVTPVKHLEQNYYTDNCELAAVRMAPDKPSNSSLK